MIYPNANQAMYGNMDMQQLMIQQQYLNNAIQNEQNRQQQLQRQMNNRMNQQSYPQTMDQVEQSIPGRLVDSEDEIRPNEVPMDGRASLFPKRDFSSIYAKAWNSNGTIQTIEYVPKVIDAPVSNTTAVVAQTEDISNVILERLDNIEKMLSNKNQNNQKTNNRPNNKKESVEDEQ